MGYVPRIVLSAEASPDDWPEKGLHIGGQKAERNPSYTTFRTFMKHKNRTRWITIVMHYFVYDFSYAMKFAVPYTIYCTIDDLFVYVMIFNKRDQKWNA